MDVLVMENLLYRRNIRRLYDLKGSSRSRYNPDTSGSNKVLLDQNLIEAMPTSPIFVGNKAKRLLERAVWNDTAFLAVSLMPFTSSILYILVFRCTFMDFLATFFSFFASIMMLGGRTYDQILQVCVCLLINQCISCIFGSILNLTNPSYSILTYS